MININTEKNIKKDSQVKNNDKAYSKDIDTRNVLKDIDTWNVLKIK